MNVIFSCPSKTTDEEEKEMWESIRPQWHPWVSDDPNSVPEEHKKLKECFQHLLLESLTRTKRGKGRLIEKLFCTYDSFFNWIKNKNCDPVTMYGARESPPKTLLLLTKPEVREIFEIIGDKEITTLAKENIKNYCERLMRETEITFKSVLEPVLDPTHGWITIDTPLPVVKSIKPKHLLKQDRASLQEQKNVIIQTWWRTRHCTAPVNYKEFSRIQPFLWIEYYERGESESYFAEYMKAEEPELYQVMFEKSKTLDEIRKLQQEMITAHRKMFPVIIPFSHVTETLSV